MHAACMLTYMQTFLLIYIHTYSHAAMHAYMIHQYIQYRLYIQTSCKHTLASTHTYKHVCCIHTYIHTYVGPYIRTKVHTYKQTYIHYITQNDMTQHISPCINFKITLHDWHAIIPTRPETYLKTSIHTQHTQTHCFALRCILYSSTHTYSYIHTPPT